LSGIGSPARIAPGPVSWYGLGGFDGETPFRGKNMKIYTGGGDRGKTSLFSGERVSKHSERVEAYGDVDELSAFLGALAESFPSAAESSRDETREIQGDLLIVGGLLATTPDSPALESLPPLPVERIRAVEAAVDRMEAELPPLKSFILPGGTPPAVWAHLGRTVCRRVERRVIRLCEGYGGRVPEHLENVVVYLNRLSDYLFVLARRANQRAGVPDVPWTG
jgi:cob(I)alamin adenosyltransferase